MLFRSYAELLPNGNLLRGGRIKEIPVGIGGVAGIVQEITWDGKVIWEFAFNNKTQIQHHCFKRLPNGNTLVLGWEKKSAKEAKAKGRDPRSIPSKPIEGKGVYTDSFWPDFCVEVNKTGKIVWEWHAWDHIGTGPDQLDIIHIHPADQADGISSDSLYPEASNPKLQHQAFPFWLFLSPFLRYQPQRDRKSVV